MRRKEEETFSVFIDYLDECEKGKSKFDDVAEQHIKFCLDVVLLKCHHIIAETFSCELATEQGKVQENVVCFTSIIIISALH